MLNDGSGFKKVYLATGFTDLRRGIDGLARIIRPSEALRTVFHLGEDLSMSSKEQLFFKITH